jgi:outer membrane receptor protein involved in Fe transport
MPAAWPGVFVFGSVGALMFFQPVWRFAALTARVLILAVIPVSGLVAPLLAQPVGPDVDPMAGVTEIIVTARKREESLQDVPLSIAAFSAEQLQGRGLLSDYDIANFTVGFRTLQQYGRDGDRPTIRGMGAPANRGEANASYFIDGVFISGSISTAVTGAVERVEVLRGPQSAQFGRATFAGAVNYVTRKPADTFEGEIIGRSGTHDDHGVSGWASGPIGDTTFSYLVSGSWSEYGGQWRNQLKAGQPAANPQNAGAAGQADYDSDSRLPLRVFLADSPQMADNTRLGAEETTDLLGKLVWRPVEGTEFNLKYGFTKSDDSHFPNLLLTELNCNLPYAGTEGEAWFPTTNGDYCGKVSADGRINRINLPDIREGVKYRFADTLPSEENPQPENYSIPGQEPGTYREQNRVLLEYIQDVGGYTLTTRGAWNKDDFEQLFDLDHTQTRAIWGLFHIDLQRDIKDKSLEFRVDSPGDLPVRYSLGAYWYDQDRENRQRSYLGPSLVLGDFFTAGGPVTSDFTPSTFIDVTNKAVFGSLDFDLAEQWTLALEARYAKDEKSLSGGALGSCDPDNPGMCSPDQVDLDFSNFTPRITLRYQPTDELMLYFLTAKGNKPGDFNTEFFRAGTHPEAVMAGLNGCSPSLPVLVNPCLPEPLAIIKEEEQWTYELGAKASWLDGRLVTNLSVYYIDWQNQGLFTNVKILQNSGTYLTTTIIRNVGRSEVKGIELETSFRATDQLSLVANYGYTDSRYVEGDDPGLLESTGNGDLSGNYVPGVPKHTLILGANITAPLTAGLTLFVTPDFVLNSKRYTSANNFSWMGNDMTLNLRAGVQADRWTLTGYVRNLTDDNTPVAVLDFFNFGSVDIEGLRDAGLIDAYGNLRNSPITGADSDVDNARDPRLYGINPKRGRDVGLEFQYRF